MKNADGYEYVRNFVHARSRATDLGLATNQYRYIDQIEKIMGLRIPNDKYYLFISPDVNESYILPLVRRG